jgi:hypothetical protein
LELSASPCELSERVLAAAVAGVMERGVAMLEKVEGRGGGNEEERWS